MKLRNAARHFDTCPVYDAYTGAALFKIQTSTFLESSTEGSTAARRVISIDPAKTLPAHRTLLLLGEIWIVGASNPDEWKGQEIRRAYWTKKVTDDFKLLTPGQAVLQAAGTRVLGQKAFLRETVNGQTDSNLDPTWTIATPESVPGVQGYFFKSGTTLYRIRNTAFDISGFWISISDQVDNPVLDIMLTGGGVYDPITDTHTTKSVYGTGIVLDYLKSFEYLTQADQRGQQGDLTLIISELLDVDIKPGLELSIGAGQPHEGKYRVINATKEFDAYNLHIRRA